MIEKRATQLDGLRAVAVLFVFVHHASQSLVPGGFLGVDIFFALSGYLITTQLLGEQMSHGRLWLAGFYARRALRLMPALLAMTATVALVGTLMGSRVATKNLLAAATYLMDIYAPLTPSAGDAVGHTWSLAVEEQFYLVWPALLVVAFSRSWSLVRVLVAAMLLSSASAGVLLLGADVGWSALYRSPVPHIAELAAGSLLAVALRGARLAWLRSQGVPVVAVAALAAALPLLHEDNSALYLGGFTCIGLISAAVVGHVLIAPAGLAARMLKARPLVVLGERSYGFYLWHFPVLWYLSKCFSSRVTVALVGLLMSVVLCELSWRYVEQPFLRIKERRWGSAARPARVTASAQPAAT